MTCNWCGREFSNQLSSTYEGCCSSKCLYEWKNNDPENYKAVKKSDELFNGCLLWIFFWPFLGWHRLFWKNRSWIVRLIGIAVLVVLYIIGSKME